MWGTLHVGAEACGGRPLSVAWAVRGSHDPCVGLPVQGAAGPLDRRAGAGPTPGQAGSRGCEDASQGGGRVRLGLQDESAGRRGAGVSADVVRNRKYKMLPGDDKERAMGDDADEGRTPKAREGRHRDDGGRSLEDMRRERDEIHSQLTRMRAERDELEIVRRTKELLGKRGGRRPGQPDQQGEVPSGAASGRQVRYDATRPAGTVRLFAQHVPQRQEASGPAR